MKKVDWPNQKTVLEKQGFSIVTKGDKLRKGDVFFNPLVKKWVPIPKILQGSEYNPDIHGKILRSQDVRKN